MARRWGLVALVLAAGAVSARSEQPQPRPATKYVLFVTTDGFRWQEMFRGADEALLNRENGGAANVEGLRKAYWRDTPEARREALLPFIWSVVATQGQLFGNVDRGSVARVANGKNFSYPGYNEMMTGFADPRIDSNAKRPNPNITVLEWLNAKPGFKGRVAAFGSWDVFPYILNQERSGIPVVAGWEPITGDALNDRQRLLNQLRESTFRPSDEGCFDSFTFHAALEHWRLRHPRLLYIGLGETDEFAHQGRYDQYLRAAHQFDAFLQQLWDEAQSSPETRGKTTLVITTDHGRGDPPRGWRDHGAGTQGSEKIWIGVLGPDTPALGERSHVEDVTQSQIAATIAALLGEDYRAEVPKAAQPIASVLRPRSP
jgi:hypothetical protein